MRLYYTWWSGSTLRVLGSMEFSFIVITPLKPTMAELVSYPSMDQINLFENFRIR